MSMPGVMILREGGHLIYVAGQIIIIIFIIIMKFYNMYCQARLSQGQTHITIKVHISETVEAYTAYEYIAGDSQP